MVDEEESNGAHGYVEHSDVALNAERAVPVHFGELHEHLVSGDSHIVECAPAVALGVETEFWAHVSCFDSFEELPGFEVTELNHEWEDADLFTVDDELGIADCVT